MFNRGEVSRIVMISNLKYLIFELKVNAVYWITSNVRRFDLLGSRLCQAEVFFTCNNGNRVDLHSI
jgi:hypothetical protein